MRYSRTLNGRLVNKTYSVTHLTTKESRAALFPAKVLQCSKRRSRRYFDKLCQAQQSFVAYRLSGPVSADHGITLAKCSIDFFGK